MSTTDTESGPDTPPGGPPPWIDESLQQRVAWRDGDIVISVPPKSGTTWMMNIVHQLRSGGDPNFADVYREVPWLELVASPTTDRDAIVAGFDNMPVTRRRAFKTHAGPPTLPFRAKGSGADVRYVVVARNPDEAIASSRPFLASHSDEWCDVWNVDKQAIIGPDLDAFIAGFATHAFVPMIFSLVAAWWPLRHEPNVMLVHYSDLKREPQATLPRIAEFLDFAVRDADWPAIYEYTSFQWMKENEDRFELRTVTDPPALDPGAMMRKGRLGASAEDGITPAISQMIAEVGNSILTDEHAHNWLYNGGPH